jgi:flagellar hook protein FlgE
MSSFSTALSGLTANNAALDVVGNNLANLNTQGFKTSDVQFKDVMGEVTSTAQTGAGVSAPYTSRQFTQGSVQSTGGLFDAAIQGNGMFVVKATSGDPLYTRDGSFKVDGNGLLVTQTGERVQGWPALNGVVNASGAPGDISVTDLAAQVPSATTQMTLSANLDATAAVGDTFSTPLQVVDSLGATHVATMNFKKTAANKWDYTVTLPGEELTAGTAGTPSSLKTGSLTFSSAGKLTTPDATAPITVPATGLKNGAADLSIDWSLYNTDGSPLLTQYAQTSAATGSTQQGIQPASVTGVSITTGGTLTATYSSGKQAVIAQIALASIGNPDSLVSAGNNNFKLGTDTLTPSVGAPGTGTRGNIVGGSIEASNVDLARELTNLIVYQRGYQANSKVITTTDQITQILLNMK